MVQLATKPKRCVQTPTPKSTQEPTREPNQEQTQAKRQKKEPIMAPIKLRKVLRAVVRDAPFHFDQCDPESPPDSIVDRAPQLSRALRAFFEDDDREGARNYESDEENFADDCEESSSDSQEEGEGDESGDDEFEQLISHMEPMPIAEQSQRREEFDNERKMQRREKRREKNEKQQEKKEKQKSDEKDLPEDDAKVSLWKNSLKPLHISGELLEPFEEAEEAGEGSFWSVRIFKLGFAKRFFDRVQAQIWIWDTLRSVYPSLKLDTDLEDLVKALENSHEKKDDSRYTGVGCLIAVAETEYTTSMCRPFGICVVFEPVVCFDHAVQLEPSNSEPTYFLGEAESIHYNCLPVGCGPFEDCMMKTRADMNDDNVVHPLDGKPYWRALFANVANQLQRTLDQKMLKMKMLALVTKAKYYEEQYYEEQYHLDYMAAIKVWTDQRFRECLEATGAQTPLYYIDSFCLHQEALQWERQRADWLNIPFKPFMTNCYDDLKQNPIGSKFLELRTMRTWGFDPEDNSALCAIRADWKMLLDPNAKHPMHWIKLCNYCNKVIFDNIPYNLEAMRHTWLEARDTVLQHHTQCRGHGHPNFGLLECFEDGNDWFQRWFDSCCLREADGVKVAQIFDQHSIQFVIASSQGGYTRIPIRKRQPGEDINALSDKDSDEEDEGVNEFVDDGHFTLANGLPGAAAML
jgi:hypothetical protein